MHKKTSYVFFIALALFCAFFAVFSTRGSGFGWILAFPFAFLANLLRNLSLSGAIGNTLALFIYFVFCLLPALGAGLKLFKKKWKARDWLLILLCGAMFAAEYLMINPGLIFNLGAAGLPVAKAVMGGVCWSILIAWLILSLLGHIEGAGFEGLRKWSGALLWILAAYFVVYVFGSKLAELADSCRAVKAGNTGYGRQLWMSYFVLALRFVCCAAAGVVSALAALRVGQLLDAMGQDRYGEQTVALAEELGSFCLRGLKLTVLLSVLSNVTQFALMGRAADVSVEVNIPLLPIAFALAALLFSGLMRENKQLKDDNDMFI